MEQRKKIAKLQKELEKNELSPEELEKLQEQIPEWKRGAVTMTDQTPHEERPGLFGRLGRKVKRSISDTDAAKQFYESEDYKKIQKMRTELNEFKSNLKEELDTT